ncbi:MAG: gliding motility lipoprotein GldH [Bacteroidales bacterium]|jgi:gliding motility-associated lipoprotein GldH|nr:gliding motility lipoprotein GldH [Bacteroidales bacterium]
MNIKKMSGVIAILLLFAACGKNVMYNEIYKFKDYQWQRLSEDKKNGNAIEFTDIEVKDCDTPYDVFVNVRHSSVINTDKIQFLVEVISPNGTRRANKHIMKLKDREGTKFIGDVMGDLYDVEDKVKSYMSFTETGTHTIRITNLSQPFVIVGIVDLSLKIVKSDLDYNL